MLSRTLKYADKRFKLDQETEKIVDSRPKPRISCGTIVREILVMNLGRLGSLNALEQLQPRGYCKHWIDGKHPSADRVGDVAELMDPAGLRSIIEAIYHVQQRGNNLPPLPDGYKLLLLDGHEQSSSYLRHCSGCLERTVTTAGGPRTQYYHRIVLAMLVHGKGSMPLDVEPQLPGEDERAAAVRLLGRVLQQYPRAFQIVAGDALYLDPKLWHLADNFGKYFIAVLKNERMDLMGDSRSLFDLTQPVTFTEGSLQRTVWDIEGFTTWSQVGYAVRVVRSLETKTVRRQRTHQIESTTSEWIWATNLPLAKAGTRAIVGFGHHRWDIENDGFNDLSRQWKTDHLYRHHPQAILAFTLLALVACIIFRTMVRNNIKPGLRADHTELFWADMTKAELYATNIRAP